MSKKKYDRVKKIVILSLISSIVAQSMPINVLAMEDKIKNVDLEEKSENKFLDKDKEDSDVISSTDKDKEDSDVTSSTGKDKDDKEDSDVTSSTGKDKDDKEDSDVTPSTGKDKDDKKDINSVSLENISIEVDPELGKDFRYGEAIDINIKFIAVGDRYGNIPQNTIVRLNISSSAIDYSKIQVSPQNHAIELIKHPDKNYVEVKFNQDFKFDRSLNLSIMTSIKSNKGTYSISSELVDKDGNIINLPLKDGVADETLNVVQPDIGVSGWLDPFWDGENYIGRGELNNGDIGGIFNPKKNEIKTKATLTAKKDVDNINTIITLDSGQRVDKKSINVIDIKTNNDITDRLSIRATDNLIEFNTGRIVENTQYLIKFTAIVDSFDNVYTTDFKSIASNGEIGGFPIKSGFRMNTGGAVPTLKANNLITYKNIPLDLLEDVVANDIEDGDITDKIVVNDSLLDLSKEGIYKVTYIVQDSDYNSVMKTVDVVVLSNDEPIIIGASNKTIKINEVDSFDKLDGVTAEDNQDGIITDRISISGEIGKPSPGSNKTYKLTYSVTDNHKNTTRVIREITVTNQLPTISGLSNITINDGMTADIQTGVSANDTEDGNITARIVYPLTDLTKLSVGNHEIKYSVTDSDGNTVEARRRVTVRQRPSIINSIPVINAYDKTLNVGDMFNPLEGVSAEDKEDGDITDKIKVIKNELQKMRLYIVADKEGVYKVVYEVEDSQGAKITKTISVTVKNKPVVPPIEPDKPVVPPTEPDKPVVPPTESDKPVVPPTEPDKPAVPPTEPDKPVVPPTESDKPVVPPTEQDKPVVPPTEQDKPVVPPTEPSKGDEPFKITIDDITNENLNPKTGDDSLLIYIGASSICLILFSIINRKKLNKK